MRLAVIVGLVLCSSLVSAQQPRPSASATRIAGEMALEEPRTNCAVANIAASLSIRTGVPFGIERLPRCEEDLRGTAPSLPVAGRTLAEVLDRLIEIDPRYSWREDDGVIVVRPASEWDRGDHFLNRMVPPFAFQRVNIGSAHAIVNGLLGTHPVFDAEADDSRSPDRDGRFDLRISDATTIVGVMDAIAREHGAMFWQVDYCQPTARRELATIMFMKIVRGGIQATRTRRITESGISGSKVYVKDANGNRIDPCDAAPQN